MNDFDSTTAQRDPLVDWHGTLLRAGGDIEFIKELVPVFMEQEAEIVDALCAAVAAKDSSAVQQAAHTLKGAIANFSEGPAWQRASGLEKTGYAGQWNEAEQELEKLQSELKLLNAALRDFEQG